MMTAMKLSHQARARRVGAFLAVAPVSIPAWRGRGAAQGTDDHPRGPGEALLSEPQYTLT
jgi:hypothetical protein